jgi:hypothetical protein
MAAVSQAPQKQTPPPAQGVVCWLLSADGEVKSCSLSLQDVNDIIVTKVCRLVCEQLHIQPPVNLSDSDSPSTTPTATSSTTSSATPSATSTAVPSATSEAVLNAASSATPAALSDSKETVKETGKQTNSLTNVNASCADDLMRDLSLDELEKAKEQQFMLCLDPFWLIMHVDNDLELKTSKLPVNKALKKFIPVSRYVGDMVLGRTVDVDVDELHKGHWTLDDFKAHLAKCRITRNKNDWGLECRFVSEESFDEE